MTSRPRESDGQHAGAAVEQDEQRVALAALLDHQLAAAEAPLDDAVGDGLRLVGGEHGEQRHAPDQVQVRQHRHRQAPVVVSRLDPGPSPTPTPGLQESRYCAHGRACRPPGPAPMSPPGRWFDPTPVRLHRTHHEHPRPARPRPHPRLRPRRLHRRAVCRARQPRADAHHRHRPGRAADDHHRGRQLAGRRRRRAGPRPDAAFPAACRALQHQDRLRPHPQGGLRPAALRARGRLGHATPATR